MPFIAKKFAAAILLPLPMSLILILIGLLLLWFSHGKRIGSLFITAGFAVLLIFSFSPLPYWLDQHLEQKYQPLTTLPPNATKIVVLGGGVRGNTDAPPNTQLGSASLARLIEGIRIYRLYQRAGIETQLILSGGRVFGSPAEAGVLENTAVILGIPRNDIVLERGSTDTRQEAKYIKKIVGKKPFVLVTSATHMPRAMWLFKQYGMHPTAAPTQFIAKQNSYSVKKFLPNATNLIHSDIAIHEYLGSAWAKLHTP